MTDTTYTVSFNLDIATAQTLFVTYAETFISSLRKQKPSTIESYTDLLEYYFLDFVEGVKLAEQRMQHFTNMLHTLLDEGYAVSQIRNAIKLTITRFRKKKERGFTPL